MPSGPAYDFSWGPEPDVSWKNSGGGRVGIWGREWHDLLGAEVLKLRRGYSWESWQPDARADREYSAQLPGGVRHRLFPAARGAFKVGLRRQEALFSEAILRELAALGGERVILMLGGAYGFHAPFFRAILASSGPAKRYPIFLRSDGMFSHPLLEFPALHKPLTYLSLLLEHFEVKRLLSYADVITEQSDGGLEAVRAVYGGRMERLGMGCDFGFWRPPAPAERAAARKRLGVEEGKKVFFASGNFLARKQLDRLAAVFGSLPDTGPAFLLVAGQGPENSVAELQRLMEPVAARGAGALLRYAEGEALRELYWASDIYVSSAADEGGPVSVMKAMACGLPVMATAAGDTADFMRSLPAGRLLPPKDYGAWRSAIEAVLSGDMPPPVDLAAARARYDWSNVAAKCADILDEISRPYFKERA